MNSFHFRPHPKSSFRTSKTYTLNQYLSIEEYENIIRADPSQYCFLPERARTTEMVRTAMQSFGCQTISELIKKQENIFPFLPKDSYTEEVCNAFFETSYCDLQKGNYTEGLPYSVLGKKHVLPFDLFMNWESVCNNAVDKKGALIAGVPQIYMTQNICDSAIKQDANLIKYVPKQFRNKEICQAAFKKNALNLEFIPSRFITSDMAIKTVKKKPEYIRYVPKKLRTKEICLIAVKQDGELLKYVPKELIDQEICESCTFGWKVSGFDLIPDGYKSKELCLRAIKLWPDNIQYVPDEIKTSSFWNEAVTENIFVLRWAPKGMVRQDVIDQVISRSPHLFYLVPLENMTRELCEIVVEKEPEMISKLPIERLDVDLCVKALERNVSSDLLPKSFKEEALRIYQKNQLVKRRDEKKTDPKLTQLYMVFDKWLSGESEGFIPDVKYAIGELSEEAQERLPEIIQRLEMIQQDQGNDKWIRWLRAVMKGLGPVSKEGLFETYLLSQKELLTSYDAKDERLVERDRLELLERIETIKQEYSK